MPAIVNATRAVWEEITDTDGLLGFSLRAQPVGGTLETLTLWSGQGALTEFLRGEAHRTAVEMTTRWISGTTIRTWSVGIAPPTWQEADQRLSAHPDSN